MAKKTILIVDDEDNVRNLLKNMLKEEGFKVKTVTSGQECLDFLKTERPDLIVMDQMMPNMSGIDTLLEIKQNPKTTDIKVLFLSVVTILEIGEKVLNDLDIVDYMEKPFNPEEFIHKVKKAIF